MSHEMLPLQGVKIVDLSMFMAAPQCGRALAEWGADVIKVEPPEGDAFRYAMMGTGFPKDENMNVLYQINNACKQHISLDLKKPEAKEILLKLLENADVLLTNFRTSALERLGLRYEDLCVRFPKLIVAQLTGYGEKGPDCDAPGYDSVAFFARSGLMIDLVEKGANPILAPWGIGDITSALALSNGVLAALFRQRQTGKGCKVSTSLFASALYVASIAVATGQKQFFSTVPQGGTRLDATMPTNGAFKCADGEWIFIAEPTPVGTRWTNLASALGKQDWVENKEMANAIYMFTHNREIILEMDRIIATKTSTEWETIFTKYGVAHQRLKHVYEQTEDPQVLENGYVFQQKFQNGESCFLVSNPVQFSDISPRELPPPGKIGQDTIEILNALNYSEERIDNLLESKVVRTTPA